MHALHWVIFFEWVVSRPGTHASVHQVVGPMVWTVSLRLVIFLFIDVLSNLQLGHVVLVKIHELTASLVLLGCLVHELTVCLQTVLTHVVVLTIFVWTQEIKVFLIKN